MPILDEEVVIKPHGTAISWYIEKGYELKSYYDKKDKLCYYKNQEILVKVKDLSPHTKVNVRTTCDFCGTYKVRDFRNLDRSRSKIGFYATGKIKCYHCGQKAVAASMVGIKRPDITGKNSPTYINGSKGFSVYKSLAKRKNIPFSLTIEQFKEITTGACHYCKGFHETEYYDKNMRNGIDKKEPKLGYILENCLSCCITCNRMKLDNSYEKFLEKITKIYKHLILKDDST